MLPSTSFHRIAIKELNVKNSELWSGPGSLALIQVGGGRAAGWIWQQLISAVNPQGQPGRSCQPISFPLPGAERKETLPFGKFQVCSIHFCPPRRSQVLPQQLMGLQIVSNAPGHRHTLWEVSTRVTLHSWRLCSEQWGVSLMPLDFSLYYSQILWCISAQL